MRSGASLGTDGSARRRSGSLLFWHGLLYEFSPGGFRNERLEIQPVTITEHVFDAK
jgi:hypothetical protein